MGTIMSAPTLDGAALKRRYDYATAPLLPAPARKHVYEGLRSLAQEVHRTQSIDDIHVYVNDTTNDRGKGLFASRNIKRGASVVWYGGLIARHNDRNFGTTHSISARNLPIRLNKANDAYLIDGRATAALYYESPTPGSDFDQAYLDILQKECAPIAGPLMNSAWIPSTSEVSAANVDISMDPLHAVYTNDGSYGAHLIVATKDIQANDEILWNYIPKLEEAPLGPLHFFDVTQIRPQSGNASKRRVCPVPISSGTSALEPMGSSPFSYSGRTLPNLSSLSFH